MKRMFILLLVVVLALAIGGCASIISGTRKGVIVSTEPSNAEVNIDGVLGKSPVSMEIKRYGDHVAKATLEGYNECHYKFEKGFNGWFLGNILLGGLIGMAIDGISGAVVTIDPDEIKMVLSQDAECIIMVRGPEKNFVNVKDLARIKKEYVEKMEAQRKTFTTQK